LADPAREAAECLLSAFFGPITAAKTSRAYGVHRGALAGRGEIDRPDADMACCACLSLEQ
jgi:hypothetical protein